MAEVTAHIWYDFSGNIVAVGRPLDPDLMIKPVGDEKTLTMEAEIEESLLKSLHRTHTVNVMQGLVVPLASSD
ncbi:hypothetical protein [Streptomyces sp. NPDC056883]|uniref:hypothetical protein n=1 Tax=Streptomyces sp. NPDC056883 TaxID=3345959 RepID=UPI003675DF34